MFSLKKTALLLTVVILTISIGRVLLFNYNQTQNVNALLAQGLDAHLIPHRIDYRYRLQNILHAKIRSFECDIHFNSRAKTPYFEIGHNSDDVHGLSLHDYLEMSQGIELKKIWLDVKNVNDDNIEAILKRLNLLDMKYHIKEIVIFESSALTSKIRLISDAGYHTSHYLQPKSLDAKKIQKLIADQHLSAISFPLEMYSFVKLHVEPIIEKNIAYHTWGTYHFKHHNELEKIKQSAAFNDARVQTIIYSYYQLTPARCSALMTMP